jgi:5,10-methylenetetrahydromethanopterin reductase
VTAASSRLSIAFQSDKTLAEYAELGALVEASGFGTVSVYNDLMFQPPLPALLAIAASTRSIRLGPSCWNPFTLHPVEIAGQVAMLDKASRGRAYLGLARGAWLESIGVRPTRPIRAMREAIAIIRHLLRGTESDVRGEVFGLRAHHRLEYPVERADVPILIGTWGARMAALAGEVASDVKVGGCANPAMVGVMRGHIAVGSARAARSPMDVGVVLGAVTVVDDDRAQARSLARAEVARYLPVVAPLDPTGEVEPDLLVRISAFVHNNEFNAAGALISDSLLDRFAFAGTPSDVAEQVGAVVRAGASRVEFGTPHGLTEREGLRLLREQVLPRLAHR